MTQGGNAASRRAGATPADDAALVARLLAGDEPAFASLVDELHGSLVRLALVFVRDPSVAEEVAQETWTAVLTGLRRFEGRSSLKRWIFHILTNLAKTRGIREGRSVPFSAFDTDAENEPAVDPARFKATGKWGAPPRAWDDETPERLLARRESMQLLERSIAALPPAQRVVVVLRDIEGLEPDEVCTILGLTESNQRVLLHRGRSKLRAALEEHIGR